MYRIGEVEFHWDSMCLHSKHVLLITGPLKVAPVPNDSNSYHLWLLYHLVPSQLDEGGSPPKAFGAETEQLACPDVFLKEKQIKGDNKKHTQKKTNVEMECIMYNTFKIA